jgi:hypothetical protein
METKAAADLIATFAQDPTYIKFPSLRAYMAARVKGKLGEITPKEKAAIWALVKPEHQAIFKDSLALHKQIHDRMYPSDDELPTPKAKKNDEHSNTSRTCPTDREAPPPSVF